MDRLYTLGVMFLCMRNGGMSYGRNLNTAIKCGRLTARSCRYDRKDFWAVSVRDVQTFLARTNRGSCSEWILSNLLDFGADVVIERGGLSAAMQQRLDKETGNAEEQQ